MDAQLKAKWVEALRSGKYQQHTGSLTNISQSAFCCLGVLCKIADIRIIGENTAASGNGTPDGYFPIKNMLGGSSYFQFSERNDGTHGHHKHSFSEIADYIEENL